MSVRKSLTLVVMLAAASGCAGTEAPAPEPAPAAAPVATGGITRLDPALDALVPANAVVEKVAGGFQFTEGPLWRPSENRLWFSDVVGNVLRAVTPTGEVEVLIENAAGQSTAPPGSYIGPNGLLAEPSGTVLMTQHFNRQIVRIGANRQTTTVVDQDKDPAKELDFNGVFRFADGKVTLLVRDLGRPNGIAFSPDLRTMYVSNTEATRKVIMAYDVAADGTVSNARVFADGTSDATPGMPDGVKVDTQGNVYATMPGGVWVIAPDGRHLGTIGAPEVAANIGWGDDGRTLYITAETGVYRVKLTAAGY
jgi:gluconolactonase